MDMTINRTGLDREFLQAAAAELRERFDAERGRFEGLSGKQEASAVLFLLAYARRTEDNWAQGMAEAVLEHRERAEGPLLAYAYLEAYAQTGRPEYRETACGVLDAAVKELRLASGAFAQPGNDAVSVTWNARMIAAFTKAYRVLGNKAYLRTAREVRFFLKTRLTQSNGRLWHHWRDRMPLDEGRLADYGLYCWALVELYEAELSVSCLREAAGLADRMTDIFRDEQGGFFEYGGGSGGSGGSAAALALVRLAQVNGIRRYRDLAREQLEWLANEGREALDGLALLGMVEELWPRKMLVCAAQIVPEWLAQVGEQYGLAVLSKTHDNSRGLENIVPFTREFPVPEDGLRLYLCQDGVCETAADDLEQLSRRLSPVGVGV